MKGIKFFIACLFLLLGMLSEVNAQPVPVTVECTEGVYPDEINWEIVNCSGTILLSGGAPFTGAVLIPDAYEIRMFDNYGDGWNGAYLIIGIDTFGYLSDVDWIDSLGQWPQNHTDTIVDVGCLTIGINESDFPYPPNLYPPVIKYYNINGQEVIPTNTGVYIKSINGIREKIFFINRNNNL